MKDKPREDRLRRVARKQGYRLTKLGQLDRKAPDYGKFLIVDTAYNILAGGSADDGKGLLSLDEVDAWLSSKGAQSTKV